MEVVRFKLSGRTAFFKKPDVNTYYYFTYGNIHKVALLGIMGSILGLGGYNTQTKNYKEQIYPEFYEKLKDAKVSVINTKPNGYITKKVQNFNNSVGYASFEEGGNLIVKEQWLQNPCWIIYIKIDEITQDFAYMIENNKAKFIPYLGKNDHFADITDVKKIDIEEEKNISSLDSLFITNKFKIDTDPDLDDYEDGYTPWKYEEYLPIRLDESLNQYEFEDFTETNMPVIKLNNDVHVYKDGELNKNLYFF